ncbi:MAG: hypothetical protein ACTSRZ_15685 [Promethearchaeota archaeon]
MTNIKYRENEQIIKKIKKLKLNYNQSNMDFRSLKNLLKLCAQYASNQACINISHPLNQIIKDNLEEIKNWLKNNDFLQIFDVQHSVELNIIMNDFLLLLKKFNIDIDDDFLEIIHKFHDRIRFIDYISFGKNYWFLIEIYHNLKKLTSFIQELNLPHSELRNLNQNIKDLENKISNGIFTNVISFSYNKKINKNPLYEDLVQIIKNSKYYNMIKEKIRDIKQNDKIFIIDEDTFIEKLIYFFSNNQNFETDEINKDFLKLTIDILHRERFLILNPDNINEKKIYKKLFGNIIKLGKYSEYEHGRIIINFLNQDPNRFKRKSEIYQNIKWPPIQLKFVLNHLIKEGLIKSNETYREGIIYYIT